MLPSDQVLSKLLNSLYDAAGEPRLWPAFLKRLSDASCGTSAALILHDPTRGEHTISLHSGFDGEAVRLYDEYYGKRDIWMQRAYPKAYAGWLSTSEEICPVDELLRSEIYNDLLTSMEVAHAMWATMDDPRSGRVNNLGIYRNRKLEPFAQDDLELLRFLLPHMKRAFRLHFQFADLRKKSEDLQIALDHVHAGIILLGTDGKVLATNRAAENLLREQGGLQVSNGMLRAENASESTRLRVLVSKAQATSTGKGLGSGGAMLVSKRGHPPLSVLVTPVRNAPFGVLSGAVRALVFVHDPEQCLRPATEILHSTFGLTTAECRVALLLGDGKSPAEIAQMLSVSLNTLKSHLASIYRKTNTSRQAQLVRLLARLPVGPA
jgi:DNA-binding CsgD family transcriptional regulator/PAS domain-containing protein